MQEPTPGAAPKTTKPRRSRRPAPAVPDWAAVASIMTFREKTKLNRAHRSLDALAAKLLVRTHGGDPAGRPGPAAAAAAERLASLAGELPWLG